MIIYTIVFVTILLAYVCDKRRRSSLDILRRANRICTLRHQQQSTQQQQQQQKKCHQYHQTTQSNKCQLQHNNHHNKQQQLSNQAQSEANVDHSHYPSIKLLDAAATKAIHDTTAREHLSPCCKMLPRPPTMPIIGHLHLLRDYAHNPWEGFNAIRQQYGNIVSLKMGIHEMALVSSKSAMNEILLAKGILFANRPNFPRYDIIFGGDRENSLALCSWSSVHKDRRKFCKTGVIPVAGTSQYELLENSINKFVQDYIKNIERELVNNAERVTLPSNQSNAHKDMTAMTITTTTTMTSATNITSASNSNNNANHNDFDEKSDNRIITPYKLVKKDLLFLTSDIFMDFLCRERYAHQDPEYEKFVEGCDYVFWDINQCYLIDFLPFLTSFGVSFFYLKHLKGVTDYLRNYIDSKIFEPRHQEHLRLRSCGQTSVDKTILHLDNLYDDATLSSTNNLRNDGIPQQDHSDSERQIHSSQEQQPVHNRDDNNNRGTSIDDVDECKTSTLSSSTVDPLFVQHHDYLNTIIKDYLDKTTSMSLADYKVGFADLLAGHAAVANNLMKLLGHLALNRKVQDMIAEEANQVVSSSSSCDIRYDDSCDNQGSNIYKNNDNEFVTLSHKPFLPITEAATYEALRIASSPIVPHVAQEDTTIDGHFIPHGTMMLFNNYHLNLSEEFWKDPKQFNPERFLEPHSVRSSNGANDGNYASSGGYRVELPPHFKPFSQGRRSCLGFKMVETTTIVTVANLCRKFILKPVDEDLTRKLLAPVGSIALDPHKSCFELQLYPR